MAEPRKFFPATSREALAFLYVQNQNLDGKTPVEISELYAAAYSQIKEAEHEKRLGQNGVDD